MVVAAVGGPAIANQTASLCQEAEWDSCPSSELQQEELGVCEPRRIKCISRKLESKLIIDIFYNLL